MNYQDVTRRLNELNNVKHRLRIALGTLGIYLPLHASLDSVLFSIYFYYTFNLFGDNNKEWKDKYFPLNGLDLYNFLEGNVSDEERKRKYKEISDELKSIVYKGSENRVLEKGLLEKFTYYKNNSDLKTSINTISNNTINTDNLLTNTQTLLNGLLSIWKWKNKVSKSNKRKIGTLLTKEDELTLLDEIWRDLISEPPFRLPVLKLTNNKFDSSKLNITISHIYIDQSNYPYTIYSTPKNNFYNIETSTKKMFSPKGWYYNQELYIDNQRPNTSLNIYYDYNPNRPYNPSDPYASYNQTLNANKAGWDTNRKSIARLDNITRSTSLSLVYMDKYQGIYEKNTQSTYFYGYLDWKPEVFLYSKGVKGTNTTTPESAGNLSVTKDKNSPMDNMNLLNNSDFGNIGLTILVPDVVEKFMLEKCPSLRQDQFSNNGGGMYSGYMSMNNDFDFLDTFNDLNLIRNIETVFLVGIYPVDSKNNIMYGDPIVFQFFSGAQLNEDLGLSFANYRKIRSSITNEKVLERKYYNIKLGQMFYRNEFSRVSTEKRITNVVTTYNSELARDILKSITYANTSIGDESKNLLYMYGKDNFMPYVGRTPIPSGQNHNVVNPDDNTNITNINLPDDVEYVFKKYGSTKIAVQLYMATNNDYNMNGLEYFKDIKDASGGIISNTSGTISSENMEYLPGSYMGIPYRTSSIWSAGTTITKDLYYPYQDTNIIAKKIPYPTWNLNSNYGLHANGSTGDSYVTEPVIIDCEKSDEYNAPWLDKRNAPYVSKIVTQDLKYYTKDDIKLKNGVKYNLMKKGIYIKIPNDLDIYMNEDKSVKKYILNQKSIEDREFYGRIRRDRYIRVIKNSLLGVALNYNPSNNAQSGKKNVTWYNNNLSSYKLFQSEKFLDIVEYGDELYLWLSGEGIADLEYAGLGKYSTVKVQLVFRNEFFRSDDINSPLNYKYVPPTGDVQLLREIAGQRVKLYRGGILVHPTEYHSKKDRFTQRKSFSDGIWTTDVDLTKDYVYKHNYTKGFPSIALDGATLSDESNDYIALDLSDDNSVYDIISIEMDHPHWLELQVDNIERSPISSMETDSNKKSLPIPINILDLENFDFLEYDIKDNLEIPLNSVFDYHNLRKLSLNLPEFIHDSRLGQEYCIDHFRMLNFWYIFRPKVKFTQVYGTQENATTITVESFEDWKARIFKENENFFNKKKVKVNNSINDSSSPYGYIFEKKWVVNLEDILNINVYPSKVDTNNNQFYDKDNNSRSLYNIMCNILLDHSIHYSNIHHEAETILGSTVFFNGPRTFNRNNVRKAKFGGYVLDRLLYSDWVFTYRKGDSKKIDDTLRLAANDTALELFFMWRYVVENMKKEQNNHSMFYADSVISVDDHVRNSFLNLLISAMYLNIDVNKRIIKENNNVYRDIENTKDYEVAINTPGIKRLIDFDNNVNCRLKTAFNEHSAVSDNNNYYNVYDHRIYKGDNRKIDNLNNKSKLRRGFRMGNKTPDNPFMGFSMPATTNPDLVPDHIHLVYCDIYWKDFDKSTNRVIDTFATPRLENSGTDIITDSLNTLRYDFTGIKERFHLNSWKDKGKHVIFRILTDVPTNEVHKDCPDIILGEYYDNKYGKGFSPNFSDNTVKYHYRYAVIAFIKWMNNNFDDLNGVVYTLELPIGINGNYHRIQNSKLVPIKEMKDIAQFISDVFSGGGYYELIGERIVPCKLVFGYSIGVARGEMRGNYGWSFNILGNRDEFDLWMKYNMYGSNSEMNDIVEGGVLYGGWVSSNFRYCDKNKFKSSFGHRGYSGVIRQDMSMEELMKPENFKELLYEMKTLTPMYVIGYVDKDRYPEQYEMLMNEMGYKYTITSAVIEDGYLKVYYSNEGKNSIKGISDTSGLDIFLKYGNSLKDKRLNISRSGINRALTNTLGNISNIHNDISYTKINMGDVLMFRTTNSITKPLTRPYITRKEFISNDAIENAYGSAMLDDVYLELTSYNEYSRSFSLNLANVNRTKSINLTDSGLLHMFISPYKNNGELKDWFENMYINSIKIDDNGWI